MKSRPFHQTDSFRFISSKQGNSYWNMALDEAILKEVSSHLSPPTLRFYAWDKPSVSIGYFQNPVTDLNLNLFKEKNIPWVRRITGGRGIFHHIELTYSFSAPLSLPDSFFPPHIKGTYQKISQGFTKGLQKLGLPIQLYTSPTQQTDLSHPNPLCFSTPSWYETLIEGKKVVGSAQKRFKKGFLQQGTILLNHRFEDFSDLFKLRQEDSHDFIGIFDFLKKEIPLIDLEKVLIAGMEEEWGIEFIEENPTQRELEISAELVERKYGTESWNMSRVIHDGGHR